MIEASVIARARAVPIQEELARRSIRLRRVGREFVGPCPVCGGTDRFAVHLVKQVWQCRRCQRGGDVIALVQHIDGVDFADAVAVLTDERPALKLDSPNLANQKPASASGDQYHASSMRLWSEAMPIAGTVAECYLRGVRRLVLPPDISPRVLRFHPSCPFGEGVRHPCLLALYRSVIGDEPRAIMRTALAPDGLKIGRKALGPAGGAAVKLADDAEVSTGLTVGEGLETTLAGMMRGFTPAWALGSSGAIAKLPVLAGVEALTILGETGDGGANERATKECFSRWRDAGREVFRASPRVGDDMNNVLNEGQATHAASMRGFI